MTQATNKGLAGYELKEGDHVVYHPVGGAMQTSTGIIKKIIIHATPADASIVQTSNSGEYYRFVIKNDHTHKETAYKRENIVQVVNE